MQTKSGVAFINMNVYNYKMLCFMNKLGYCYKTRNELSLLLLGPQKVSGQRHLVVKKLTKFKKNANNF